MHQPNCATQPGAPFPPPLPSPLPTQVVADINKQRDEDVADIQPNLAALKPKLT